MNLCFMKTTVRNNHKETYQLQNTYVTETVERTTICCHTAIKTPPYTILLYKLIA